MPKTYGMTKKSSLESYIRQVCVCILPSIKELSDTTGLSRQSVSLYLKEWDSNGLLVIKIGKLYLKREYCPECSIDVPEQYKFFKCKDEELKDYYVYNADWGTFVYATCPSCKLKFVSRDTGEYEEAVIQ